MVKPDICTCHRAEGVPPDSIRKEKIEKKKQKEKKIQWSD